MCLYSTEVHKWCILTLKYIEWKHGSDTPDAQVKDQKMETINHVHHPFCCPDCASFLKGSMTSQDPVSRA